MNHFDKSDYGPLSKQVSSQRHFQLPLLPSKTDFPKIIKEESKRELQ